MRKKLLIFLAILLILAAFSYGVGYGFSVYLGNDLTQQVEQMQKEQELLKGY